ncbi:MAG TPA: hypothetical protein PK358_04825 [Spirochaetota bacterium]|nr:hypothetical protein [Spirochaetota bacterium]HPJ34136.1 hypothetical protein [Spirochaetota bacterium]
MENEKIFLGNLNFKATEDDVKELLSAYGTVEKIRYVRKKGHALAQMSARKEAEAVIENLDGTSFMERALRVNFEQPSRKRKGGSSGNSESRSKTATDKKMKSAPGDKKKNNRDMKGREKGEKTSSRKNLQEDYDDTKWNRKLSDDEMRSSKFESAGGYYSRSFKKRLEKATHAFSKYKFKHGYNDSSDDFMKDEFGRDYRDLEKEAERKHSGGRPKNGSGNRKSDGSGNGNSRGSEGKRGSSRNDQRKVRGRNSENNSEGARRNSRPGSGNMNSSQGSQGKSQRRGRR